MPDDILNAAVNGKLVLFCGAGISTENKTVLPFSFYDDIQKELPDVDKSLSFSQLMQQYCDLPNGRRKLIRKIKERFDYIHAFPELERNATKFHRELSEIHMISTIVTTNWDSYFEEYCAATPISIPEDFVFWDESERCVLKIHGSINNLSTIIATKNDYDKCAESLKTGIIGATLKNILINRTVVFIGFSFGDEDFLQIIDYLHVEMKEFMPHIYIITLNNNLCTKLNYTNCTCILTDGTYFLHRLKLSLKEKELIANIDTLPFIMQIDDYISDLHRKISNICIYEYPCVIYCLAYQDGVKHAFERYIQLYNKGIYNIPGRLFATAREYEKIIQKCSKFKNYWVEAYYEGYLNGLVLIGSCEEDPEIVREFPFLYLPNARQVLNSYDRFFEELKRVTKRSDKYHKYALSITEKYREPDTVVHHPPY